MQIYIYSGVFALFLSSLFSTLSCCFRQTGDAGISRLIDKNPTSDNIISKWQNRWNILLLSIRACLGLSEIVAIYCAVHLSHDMTFTELGFLTFIAILLYMVFIRVIPFILSESYADRISIKSLPLISGIATILYGFIWPIDRIENRLLERALSTSDDDDHPTPEDEILSVMEQADLEELNEDEREMIRSVFELGETVAREIMTPRVNLEGIKDDLTIKESLSIIQKSPHTRFPVYHEKLDDILGTVHVKDILNEISEGKEDQPISSIAKKIEFIPETMSVNLLLKEMKRKRAKMVLVVDEYGGTSGIVCMEDIIEELVGEICDEYDATDSELQERPDGSYLIDARMPVADLNEKLDLNIEEHDEFDSIGGFILFTLGHIPNIGKKIETDEVSLTIIAANPRQIKRIRLVKNNK